MLFFILYLQGQTRGSNPFQLVSVEMKLRCLLLLIRNQLVSEKTRIRSEVDEPYSCLLLLIRNQCRGTPRLVATYLHTNLPASSFNVKATVCAISHAVKLMLNRMGHNFPLCLWLWHTHTQNQFSYQEALVI